MKPAIHIDDAGEQGGIAPRPASASVIAGKLARKLAGLLPNPPLSASAIDLISEPAVADNVNLERLLHPQLTSLRNGLAGYLTPR